MSAAQPRIQVLTPEWPAPAGVRAAFTLRTGGVSASPFDTLNVGTHVGDSASAVAENRRRIRRQLQLPDEPAWLTQVHGSRVIDLDSPAEREHAAGDALQPGAIADGCLTCSRDRICVVQVADCLPVLFAALDGSAIAAAHAGWRGLAAGVLETTVAALGLDGQQLLAWLGPAIGREHYEVGEEVREAFVNHDPGASVAFARNPRGRWQCDLVWLARRRLAAVALTAVSGGRWCTFSDPKRFFSYRRAGRCGRMAALIWRT